jgi:prevent-host-death family protein
VHEITASDASRNFSALLDSAAQGETIVITRGGRRIAQITPVSGGNGGSLRAVLGRWHGTAVDDQLAANIMAALAAADAQLDTDPWED